MTETLDRLTDVELVIAGVVLALLASGAFWLLRVGLRPLERIAETAAGIADGDLDVRVSPAETSTEVGRLGLALNGMLERLEEAFSRRDQSEEQLRRFVANASHELRTPLTSIRGYAALFRRGAQDNPGDLAKSMARIESEATRMSALIDDMLLLARLDERRPLVRRRVDLVPIALDAAEDARARDPGRPITVREHGHVVVTGDEQRLRQVAANLLANAQMHTPPGTPVQVDVAVRGDQAILSVARRGAGNRLRAGTPHLRALLPRDPGRYPGRGAAERRHRPRSRDRRGDHGGPRRGRHRPVDSRSRRDVRSFAPPRLIDPVGTRRTGGVSVARFPGFPTLEDERTGDHRSFNTRRGEPT